MTRDLFVQHYRDCIFQAKENTRLEYNNASGWRANNPRYVAQGDILTVTEFRNTVGVLSIATRETLNHIELSYFDRAFYRIGHPIKWSDLKNDGYFETKYIPGRGICGLHRLVYTIGLCYGIYERGYAGRYCFDKIGEARFAIRNWNGRGDPGDEWIKHKAIGNEYTNPKLIGNE